ncbi:MAG TPA: universal stress protein [Gemmatimonadales bacterium]|nr:universal stress protein [Gemmatimonadales bacterium]
MAWKPIVVGVDASHEATEAAAFAMRISHRAGARCHVVHAARDPLIAWQASEGSRYREALIQQAREELLAGLRSAVPTDVLSDLAVRLGSAPRVVTDVASEIGAELIVLGGKHHSALGRWLGGSTSLNVARITEVPLLVTAGAGRGIRRVLVAVDVSSAAAPTLAVAQRYAALFGAELRALSVIEPLPVIPEITPPYDVSQYYALSEELLQGKVWPLLHAAGVQTLVRYGMTVETILHEATEWRTDLLVVGSHGKGWAERMLVGSVTERLLNHLPTSLLVVPTRTARALVTEQGWAADQAQPAIAIA